MCPQCGQKQLRGRWTLLSSLPSKGDWCKTGGIWVTSSIKRGHKKTCRLQDPDQKRLGCIASTQIKIDGVLWAAVIIIADAEEDCWDVSWLTCGCLQLVFILWKWCCRRKADPSKTGGDYGYKHRPFIPSHPSVLREGAGAWLCGLSGFGDCSSHSPMAPLRCFHALPTVGGSGHHLFSDLPSRLFITTCDLQYDPLTLF